ncbi:MAG: carbohydrate ABC transporter permease [Dehalococcoidales bacterium]|nr:carbohydrate ABC transporter permease [Dehalococcoidales bacterium]
MSTDAITIRPSLRPRRRWRKLLSSVLIYAAILLVICPFMFVFLWMLLSSVKTGVQQTAWPPLFIFEPTLNNYAEVFAKVPFFSYAINSVIVSASATVLGLVLGLPAAYSIARWKQSRLAIAILTSRMVPWISFLLPWYLLFSQTAMIDTYQALILTHLIITMPMIIWLMIGFFEDLPSELEDAALIDGCSRLGVFMRICVPLASPGIVASAILGLIYSWNNFIFALILAGRKTMTLPVAVYSFMSYTEVNWGGITAAATLIALPVLVLTFAIQRYLIKGLALGGVKA